ncbi:MAG: hypothetical protein KDK39_03120 [Leptospiraceae bacterium]|nr:hypothetical protein [Leptospiraceae bacterium]
MKRFNILKSLLTTLGLVLTVSWLVAQPQSAAPHVSPLPLASAYEEELPKTRAMLPQATVSLSGLKAVLIGAPIDGDQGSQTRKQIENLKATAAELRQNKVQVYEFYSPANQWSRIKASARGAHFLIYRGHGVYDGERPPGWVGGFSLSESFVSAEQIRRDLKLAKGAIVMLYGCFTAGNAGYDIGQIDAAEAARRVQQYSAPFVANQAGAYYASWHADAFQYYIAWLFAGKSVSQSWQAYRAYDAATVVRKELPGQSSYVLWLDPDDYQGKTAWDNAFVGQADATLVGLFGEPSTFVKFRNWIMD